jgi:hypothetical protein
MFLSFLEPGLSALGRLEYPFVIIIFSLLFCFLLYFFLKHLSGIKLGWKDAFFLVAFIIAFVFLYSAFSFRHEPFFGHDAQVWTYLNHVDIMRDPEIPFSEKMILLPFVHPSHPMGYSFVLYLFSLFSGFARKISLLNPLVFVSAGILLYFLLKTTKLSRLASFALLCFIFFNPITLYGSLYSVAEFFSLFLIVALVPVFCSLEGNRKLFMPKPKRYFLVSLFLLILLAMAYIKFEHGAIFFLIPFVFSYKFLKKNKAFSAVALSAFFILAAPFVYHVLFFNVNRGFSLYYFFMNVSESLLSYFPSFFIFLGFSVFTAFYVFYFKKWWALLPFFFLILFSSFETSTFVNQKYFFSYLLFFFFVLLACFFESGSIELIKRKSLIKMAFISLLVFLAGASLFFGFYAYPSIYGHVSTQKSHGLDFISKAANCSYLESVADIGSARFTLYNIPFSDMLSDNLMAFYSDERCIKRFDHTISFEDYRPEAGETLIVFAERADFDVRDELASLNISFELVYNESPEFIILRIPG